MQSRLEEEESAKAALMTRIQKLTKLILVSTKASNSTVASSTAASNAGGGGADGKGGAWAGANSKMRRRLSFGEEDVSAGLDRKTRSSL